jgi:hypothetical protein
MDTGSSPPKCSDRLWDPLSLLLKEFFIRGQSGLDVVLIAIFHLVMRLSVSADKGVHPLHSFMALAGTTLLLPCFFFLSLSEFYLILNSRQN